MGTGNISKFIFLLFIAVCITELINAQKQKSTTTTTSTSTSTSTSAPKTTSESSLDAAVGGSIGNPGAQIRFSTKALDSVYHHALDKISSTIKYMTVPDVVIPIGRAKLTIKSINITEAKIPNYDRELLPPNRIRSRLSGGKIESVGEWQYKSFDGARSASSGIFRTIVSNAELNVTNQLSRTRDAKPTIQTVHCKADLSQLRVEFEGFADNTTASEKWQNSLRQKIRTYFEDSVCQSARNYIEDIIDRTLSTFPTRINLGGAGNRFVLDYDLLNGEPKVNETFIQSFLEGDVLSRGTGSAPFHASALSLLDDRQKMISFSLGDYAFNTLLFHAHNQQYRFSANDSLSTSPQSIKDLLKMNCSTSIVARRFKSMRSSDARCLGSIFENATTTTIGQYPSDAVGDLVFKTQRPLQVIVRQSPQKGHLHGTSGSLEAYGPVGANGKRELLGRADVQLLHGDFSPKLNVSNITGSVNVTNLQLIKSSHPPVQARIRSFDDPTLSQLAKLSTPILTAMFNSFFEQFAQFPVPLVAGYECASSEFRWTQRTMQIDCDVRASPNANITDTTTKGDDCLPKSCAYSRCCTANCYTHSCRKCEYWCKVCYSKPCLW